MPTIATQDIFWYGSNYGGAACLVVILWGRAARILLVSRLEFPRVERVGKWGQHTRHTDVLLVRLRVDPNDLRCALAAQPHAATLDDCHADAGFFEWSGTGCRSLPHQRGNY